MSSPSVSVVINTFNRAASLQTTLRSLARQRYTNFEVVVVNGPSSDGTAEVLDGQRGRLKVASCATANLSRSRNIGIEHASGEIVAFIDDDAIAETRWLDELVKPFDDPEVVGAGGIVFDNTGVEYQYRYGCTSRTGAVHFAATPDPAHTQPGADPFLTLMGTNCAFRRDALLSISGFDEEIEYYLDETEVCMQLIDRGGRLVVSETAGVHHRFLPSHLRRRPQLWTDPFPPVKNRYYFGLLNSSSERRMVLDEIDSWVEGFAGLARVERDAGALTPDELAHALRRIDEARTTGIERAERGPLRRPLSSTSARLLRYPTDPPASAVARIAPAPSIAAADSPDEVHDFVEDSDSSRVDSDGVMWVHRVHAEPRLVPAIDALTERDEILTAAAVEAAVGAVDRRVGFDRIERGERSRSLASFGLARDIEAALRDSTKHPHDRASALAWALVAPTPEFVSKCYQVVLDRHPDAATLDQLTAGLDGGAPRRLWLDQLIDSPEAATKNLDWSFRHDIDSAWRVAIERRLRETSELTDDTAFVEAAFLLLVHRPVDDAGRASHLALARRQGRAATVEAIATSDEAKAKRLPPISFRSKPASRWPRLLGRRT